ncbi:hypothetical protein K432DRAFT_87251 [Lepidopterella palustris CBS 459.81]|uniref:Uncharacterized protein n=1 Tax=Lepidopterella palustris CBS 459.81 TaxID=1314670 RepID=A0A8E2DW93_9PEZI|nr:hypothetical protein K432DRAFT_87251 [Lepidopterella palustris CBS 459.81]
MAWRYAYRPILPIRIYIMTKLTALCIPLCVLRVPLPGFTPSLCSCLPCLAASYNTFYFFLIF